MTDTLPDRLALDPASKYHDADLLQREIGVRFNGVEKTNVEEYCISEGWIRVAAGKAVDRKGRPLTLKLKGEVEAGRALLSHACGLRGQAAPAPCDTGSHTAARPAASAQQQRAASQSSCSQHSTGREAQC